MVQKLLQILPFLLVLSLVSGDNFTAKYPSIDARKGRLLSFNTEESEIKIDLDFSVPFLKIPLKKSPDKPFGGLMANLNVGALALAGIMAFGAIFVIPATYGIFNKKHIFHRSRKSRSRSEEDSSSLWRLISSVDQALSNNDIDSTSCLQRAICWGVQSSNANLVQGGGSSADKIIGGLASSAWVNYMMPAVMQAAVASGLNGVECSVEFPRCAVSRKSVQRFGRQLLNAMYSRK